MKKGVSTYSIDTGKYSIRAGQTVNTLASAYVFGAFRLPYGDIDKKILDKSVQILLDSQLDTGIWGYNTTLPDSEDDDYSSLGDHVNSRKHVVLVAMGIHALFVAQPFGATRCIKKAAEWLLKQQQPDGGWYQCGDPKYSNQVHTTVLVLDALEIASTSGKTRPLITYKREQKGEDYYTAKHPKKKKQKRSLSANKAKQQDLIIQRLKNTVFIIEDDNTISLAYEGIIENMGLKESHALDLILFLSKENRLTPQELKSKLQSNNTPTKIARDINRALVNWIDKTNLIELPNDFEIIDYDDDIGIYYSRIQIATKDQYDKQSFKKIEEIVYDPFENSDTED